MKNLKSLTIGILSLSIAACGSPQQNWLDAITGEGVFVTRPENEGSDVTIIKLKTPALFEATSVQNGKLTVEPRHIALIEAEQEAVIKDLKKLSPDIKIIFTYQRVMNGLAIFAPQALFEKIEALSGVDKHFKSDIFERPLEEEGAVKKLGTRNSVDFIGAAKAHARGIKGQGITVGIIDTGIDYTHKMFNGAGTEEAYKAIDPRLPNPAFPNEKIVGGIDLAGSFFSPGSTNESLRIPQPDANPIDEASHGTHVAGTVAGLGDGIQSHDGVAPEAKLHAIKVFSPGGATMDFVVIAGLEYAADPNKDFDFGDKLDVVNLSLGAAFGNAYIMYNHAIRNLVAGGTVVVAAAGNSGDVPFIVGAPSVIDEAISVAASVDDSELNTEFPAVEFSAGSTNLVVEAIEGAVTRKIETLPSLTGEIVYMGLGDKEPSAEVQEQLRGRVALSERGVVAFTDKIGMAQRYGAIGIIVANNADEDPIVMGGEGSFDIPGFMISKKDGAKLKTLMSQQTVVANLKSSQIISKPWLIDTITEFSSRGPRSVDGFIKPEISAPGNKIVSATASGGATAHMSNGTSMAAPHIAGVAALMLSNKKQLKPQDVKSLMMTTSKVIGIKGDRYPVSRQGAGRVEIMAALDAKISSSPSALSLGITDIDQQKTFSQRLTLTNISKENLSLKLRWTGSSSVTLKTKSVYLPAGVGMVVRVDMTINAATFASPINEVDGFVEFLENDQKIAHLPVLALVRKISGIEGKDLRIHSSGKSDAAGSKASFTVKNNNVNPGYAFPFIKLATDKRKVNKQNDPSKNMGCDLQSAGYRIIHTEGKRILQVAMKLYDAQTSWNRCEVNMQIDANGDGITDQELAGTIGSYIAGVNIPQYVSVLLDGQKARDLRKKYEQDFVTNPAKAQENYLQAVVATRGMKNFDLSTLTIMEVDTALLKTSNQNQISVRLSTTHNSINVIDYDDYLGKHTTEWEKLPLDEASLSYSDLPYRISLQGNSERTYVATKGFDTRELVLYMPDNRVVNSTTLKDSQSQVLKPKYGIAD